MVRLLLERKVVESAAKWWQVEEWVTGKNPPNCLEDYRALHNFIVKLSEEEG
jgi:hypothetical protein